MFSPVGVPDILSHNRLSRAQADIKTRWEQAQKELATGEAADRFKATGGDPTRLLAIERTLSTLDSRTPLLSMARSRAEGMQTSMEGIQTATEQMGVKLLRDIATGDFSSARFAARDAKTALKQVMGALNVELSGRHLFAGADVGAPLADAEALLDDVRTLFLPDPPLDPVADALTPAQIRDRVKAYFDGPTTQLPSGRSFDANIYTGSADPPPPVELADGEPLSYALPANAQAFKDMMRGLALAVVTAEHFGAATQTAELSDMLNEAGRTVIKATDDITKLRSDLGLAEQRIDAAQVRTVAQRATLERARADLIGVDGYEAATRVTQLETQLQAIYAMTGRSSQLSLLNFLR